MSASQRQEDSLRTPKYDPEFDSELAELHSDWFRAEEFVQGVEWVLVHDPTAGRRLSDYSMLWCISVAAIDDVPSAMVYYSFDDTAVYFHSIKVLDDGCDLG